MVITIFIEPAAKSSLFWQVSWSQREGAYRSEINDAVLILIAIIKINFDVDETLEMLSNLRNVIRQGFTVNLNSVNGFTDLINAGKINRADINIDFLGATSSNHHRSQRQGKTKPLHLYSFY